MQKSAKWGLAIGFFIHLALLPGCGGTTDPDPSDVENREPSADIRVSSSIGRVPFTVALDAGASTDPDGAIDQFQWDLGNGDQRSGRTVNYTYNTAGNFTVELTVVDDKGATALAQTEIVVSEGNLKPEAVIATSDERGSVPFAVEFSAQNSDDIDGEISAYRWQFGDGDEATGAMVTHSYPDPGEFTVTLTVEDDEGATATSTAEVVALNRSANFTVSGSINALPYNDVDGDLNDPNAPFTSNTEAPQSIGNPVVLNGFATRGGTGNSGDVFANDSDLHDFYQVDLQSGNYVSMRIANYEFADLDLYLIEENHGVVASSTGTGEFESLQAPASGTYQVMVDVSSGTSNYLLNIGPTSLVSGPAKVGQRGDFAVNQAVVKFDSRRGDSAMKQLARGAQLQYSHRRSHRAALARFNELNPQTRQAFHMRRLQGFGKTLAQRNERVQAQVDTLRAIKTLRQRDDVEYAEPNYKMHRQVVPSDPNYELQWHYPAINLPQAWDITRGDSSIIVAVIDSGVYLTHPEVEGQLTPGFDFIRDSESARDGDGIDNDPNDPGDSAYIGNSSWHGTHVAGTIAGVWNNNEGGVGVAPGVRVMPLRALGRGGGLGYDILQAVRYAAGLENDSGRLPEQRADVVNLSLGGSGYSQAAQDTFSEAREQGVLLVAAAGNENTSEVMYPASYDGVVSVSAVDFSGDKAPYSNYNEFVDVAAPGGNVYQDGNGDGYYDGILSAVVVETETSRTPGYALYQGTSMAAPHVSGVLALMKSVYPELTPDELDSLLINGDLTLDRGIPGRDNLYGHGSIDAYLAVQAARYLADGGATAAVVAEPSSLFFEPSVDEKSLTLRGIGNAQIDVQSFSASADWVSVTTLPDDDRGRRQYAVTVERSAFDTGFHQAEIEFTTTAGTQVTVPLTLQVGDPTALGNAGYLYTLLIDAESGQTLQVVEGAVDNGRYSFRFDYVTVGSYFLATGSDVNNDGYICDAGETCGSYPAIGELDLLDVDRDLTDLEFAAGVFNALNTNRSGSEDEKGYSRIVQP